MLRKSSAVVVLFILSLAIIGAAQSPTRDPEKENSFLEELGAIADTATVDKFVAATTALDSGEYEEAKTLYEEVLKAAPEFEPALRRLGYTYNMLGHREEALRLTVKALVKNRSVDNLMGRAGTLVRSQSPMFKPTNAETKEALELAQEAWQKSGQTEEDAGVLIAEILLQLERYDEFKRFAPAFREKFPNSAGAAYYNAIAIAESGDLAAAETEVERSRQLGAPEEAVGPLAASISTAQDEAYLGMGRYRGYGRIALILVVVWFAVLVALLLVGWYLSKRTMKAIETSDPNDVTGKAQSTLKKIYRSVVTIAGVYYYISQPVVIFLIVVFTVATIFAFFFVGHIPIFFLLGVVVAGAASVYFMIKTLFTRVKAEDPGRSLLEAEAPKLWELAREVASTIGTRPVTEIRLVQGADLAVYERGSFRAKMSDKAERILILGIAVLKDFEKNAFRAVLAHEYGHFSNRDTAGGDIAFKVNTDILRTAESMVASETNTIYNIGFHFLRLFHFLFRRITHGASRLQEVLADRVAAYHFGVEAFREGLRHVIRREIEFRQLADIEIGAALQDRRSFANLYELTVADDTVREAIDNEFDVVFARDTSQDDTHPSPQDRFRYIDGIRSDTLEPLSGTVWELFEDPAAITAEMNALVEKLVRPSYQQSDSILGV